MASDDEWDSPLDDLDPDVGNDSGGDTSSTSSESADDLDGIDVTPPVTQADMSPEELLEVSHIISYFFSVLIRPGVSLLGAQGNPAQPTAACREIPGFED